MTVRIKSRIVRLEGLCAVHNSLVAPRHKAYGYFHNYFIVFTSTPNNQQAAKFHRVNTFFCSSTSKQFTELPLWYSRSLCVYVSCILAHHQFCLFFFLTVTFKIVSHILSYRNHFFFPKNSNLAKINKPYSSYFFCICN